MFFFVYFHFIFEKFLPTLFPHNLQKIGYFFNEICFKWFSHGIDYDFIGIYHERNFGGLERAQELTLFRDSFNENFCKCFSHLWLYWGFDNKRKEEDRWVSTHTYWHKSYKSLQKETWRLKRIWAHQCFSEGGGQINSEIIGI